MRKRSIHILLVGFCVLLAACGRTETASQPATATQAAVQAQGLDVMVGFQAEVYATGLRNPTALAYGPDKKLYVTQLNGQEDAGTGQVVRIDGPSAAPVVVLDKLLKPTGLAWRGDELWLATKRDILQTTLSGTTFAPPATVVKDLPFNGRSNGQIDALPDGRLIFESSGGDDPNSAVLLALKPGATQPEVYAKGFKGAYAHAVDLNSNALWTTEINDDQLAGTTPQEEVNQVSEGKDYGWPRCYNDLQPAPERGGSKKLCKATEKPIALFEAHATPTGLEWGGNTNWSRPYSYGLFVALWNGQPPRVVLVQLGDPLLGKAPTFVGGLKRPIDVLAARGGGLLVADWETGIIYLVRKG